MNVVLTDKKEDPRNSRPVSLTSVPGKVMEFMLGSAEKHAKDNAVVDQSQNSFMRGKSCLSNLISFYDKVTHPDDQGKPVDVIFLDFNKAFDTVSHGILPDKMSSTQLHKHIMGWEEKERTEWEEDNAFTKVWMSYCAVTLIERILILERALTSKRLEDCPPHVDQQYGCRLVVVVAVIEPSHFF
ncbi:hypothetical protein BTVI_59259 [Pitangus sulphuratus]|nr:hypothetical protein BTVI_59259 [Pitangus sulphuratus]